jgi:hypothetical protein
MTALRSAALITAISKFWGIAVRSSWTMPMSASATPIRTGIDHLVLHDRLVSKNAVHKIVGPLVGIYADVATMVMAGTRPA